MKRQIAIFLLLIFFISPLAGFAQMRSPQNPRLGFIIHGGAGVISRKDLTPQKEAEFRKKLEEAVLAGYKVLQSGKTSLDAVETAIRIMEDSPLFNAGKGAVFTADGKNELDASIMEGKGLNAGSVAGLHRVKNPISLARKVMENSPHVMMIGDGAEKFAREQKIELVPAQYFWTKHRWDALQKIIKEEKAKNKKVSEFRNPSSQNERYGTVGAVALDKNGDLAAGTSTGGMTYKKYGRVGDAPIIGAGTYANNQTCGVSATGWGEYFIRLSIARDISAIVEYKGVSIQEAVDTVIKQKLQNLGGDGGVVALDKNGNIGISFNSEGMYRAYIDENGKPIVQIY
ncbi:MAG: isoaspartyl peptidase/L-asparaginase [Acidobacteriota bacterium]